MEYVLPYYPSIINHDKISTTMKKLKKGTRNANVQLSSQCCTKKCTLFGFISGTQRNRSVSSPPNTEIHTHPRTYADSAREKPTPVPEISVQSARNSYNITGGWDWWVLPPILPTPRPTARQRCRRRRLSGVEREPRLNKLSVVCYKNDNADTVRHVLD